MSDGISGSTAEPNSAPYPSTNLENSPPSKNDALKHVNTQFIFNINKNCFESGGHEHDKDSPTPTGDDGNVKVQIEQDGSKCNCGSIECKCTCRKCAGPPHYEYAHRELPQGSNKKLDA